MRLLYETKYFSPRDNVKTSVEWNAFYNHSKSYFAFLGMFLPTSSNRLPLIVKCAEWTPGTSCWKGGKRQRRWHRATKGALCTTVTPRSSQICMHTPDTLPPANSSSQNLGSKSLLESDSPCYWAVIHTKGGRSEAGTWGRAPCFELKGILAIRWTSSSTKLLKKKGEKFSVFSGEKWKSFKKSYFRLYGFHSSRPPKATVLT